MLEPTQVANVLVFGGGLLMILSQIRQRRKPFEEIAAVGVLLAAVAAGVWESVPPNTVSPDGATASQSTTTPLGTTGVVLGFSLVFVLTKSASADSSRRSSLSAGPTLMLAGTALVAATTQSMVDLWLALELASCSQALFFRSSEQPPSPAAGRSAWTMVLVSSLFLCLGVALTNDPLNLRSPHASGSQDVVIAGKDLPQSPSQIVSTVFLVSSLSMRLMAAPFHLLLMHASEAVAVRRLLVMATLGRLTPTIAFLRCVVFGQAASPTAAIVLGVIATASLLIGMILSFQAQSIRRLLVSTMQLTLGVQFAAMAASCWITAVPASRPPSISVLSFVTAAAWSATLFDAAGLLCWTLVVLSISSHGRCCEYLEEFQGLGRTERRTAFLLSAATLCLVGAPLTPAFWSRWETVLTLWTARRDASYDGPPEMHPYFFLLMMLLAAGWLTQIASGLRILESIWQRGPLTRPTIARQSPALMIAAGMVLALIFCGLFPSLVIVRLSDPLLVPPFAIPRDKSAPGSGKAKVSGNLRKIESKRGLVVQRERTELGLGGRA